MAVSNVTSSTSLNDAPAGTNPKGILGKDDFMKLLLVELQHQDPTAPMDSEKILSQTSQLATLEASENTNKALSELAASMGNTLQFTTIAAIGKMADLGSDAISHEEDTTSTFEMYFPTDIQEGTLTITDNNGNVVRTQDIGTNPQGIYSFDWDGMTTSGNIAESGTYHVNATYLDGNGQTQQTRIGAYPIESVRFEGSETLVKLGSNYIPFSSIHEIY